eukprot:1182648-Ditylum_brightwellii.AAC.1
MEQGISFSSDQHDTLSSFVHIPYKGDCLAAFSDTNWGPQDQSVPTTPIEVPMDKLQSMSGAVFIRNGGPISWTCQHQDNIVLSTCQAEVVATTE